MADVSTEQMGRLLEIAKQSEEESHDTFFQRREDQAQQLVPSSQVAPHLDVEKGNWKSALSKRQQGENQVIDQRDPGNAALILANDDRWSRVIAFDEFAHKVVWRRDPPPVAGMKAPEGQIKDEDLIYIQHWLRMVYGLRFNSQAVFSAVQHAAKLHSTHPVREWLAAMEWDGRERLNTWLAEYFNAKDNPITSKIGRWWMLGAVARIFKPGCQVDSTLVLEGQQGAGKSSGMEVLAGSEWFCPTLGDLRQKDTIDRLHRSAWVVEIPELDSFKGQRSSKIKEFLTVRVDRYRPPYGHFTLVRPRQCVFVATTNEDAYLQDATGNRRFWPVKIGRVEFKRLIQDREQLWAEAVQCYRGGERWWPQCADDEDGLADVQSVRFQVDPWEEIISEWLSGQGASVSMVEVLRYLDIEKERWDKLAQMRVGKIMCRLRWDRARTTHDGKRVYRYMRPESK